MRRNSVRPGQRLQVRPVDLLARQAQRFAGGAEGVFVAGLAGLGQLQDGQKIGFELTTDRRSGKESADSLRAV